MIKCIFLFLVAFPVFSQEDTARSRNDFLNPKLPIHNLLTRTAFFRMPQKDTLYRFPDHLIVFESEMLKWGNVLLRKDHDYYINYAHGEVRFAFSLEEGDSITGSYQVFPFGIAPKYTGTFFVGGDSAIHDSFSNMPVAHSTGNSEPLQELNGYGVITRGISVGNNQTTSLTSGLNVQIAGTITDDVTIEASLSDENSPIQPDGNTESLQEIDKVFIQVKKGDTFRSTLGDIEFNFDGTEFSGVSRKLQGLQGELRTDNVHVGANYGNPKGLYQSQKLAIQDGVQGPYELLGKNVERNIIVVAGSEKVWLNGVLLRRGDNNDYTVNYNAGQITFTPKRPVSSEQRFVVDFQYASDLFVRTTGFSYVKKSWFDNKLKIGASFLKEADDKNNPLNITIDPAIRDSLRRLDNKSINQNGVYISGAQKTTRGAYRLAIAASESIYVFVGTDSIGDHNVRFSEVGAGRGDYIQGNVIGEYVYVGKGNGIFLPVVLLKLPTQEQLADFTIEIQPLSFLNIRSEIAYSDFDNNTYSKNTLGGKAYLFQANVTRAKIKNFGELDVQARWRHKDSLFHEADRTNLPEYDRSWNIPSNSGGDESEREYTLRYRPFRRLSLSNFFGDLERTGNVSSKRVGGGVAWNDSGYSRANFNVAKISTNLVSSSIKSDVIRRDGNASYTVFHFTPGIEFETEQTNNVQHDSGYGSAFERIKPKLDFMQGTFFQSGLSFDRRLDKLSNDIDSLRGHVSKTINYQTYVRTRLNSNINSSLEFSHYEKVFSSKFADVNHLDKSSNLAAITLDAAFIDRAIQINMDYQLSDERIQNRKIIFIPVLSNTGNFTRAEADSFRQVPQGQGDWIQSSVRSQGFSPVAGIRFATRWTINYGRLFAKDADSTAKGNILRALSTEIVCRIEENQSNPSRSFYFLNVNDFMRKNTLRGSAYFKNDMMYRYESGLWRWRYELQKSKIQLYQDGGEFQKRISNSLWQRHSLNEEFAVENEVGFETSRRLTTVRIGSLNSNFLIQASSLAPSIIYRPTPNWEFTQKLGVKKLRDQFSERKAVLLNVLPQAGYSWLEKGRAIFSVELTKLVLDKRTTNAPFELTQGFVRGWNSLWSVNFGYKINDHMTADLNYTGRKLSGQKAIHIGNAEVKAYF